MSKNITIQEGGVAKQLTVDKLKTNLVSSGTCLWVPEDDVQLTTKTITENGTYKASDDEYYGYSEVIVSIANAGTAIGTDGDGDEAVVYTDPTTGQLVEEKVPSSIKVITPPTNPYGIYTNGQTITKDGMVVKAYLKTGGEYGTVSNDEITLDPTMAVYDSSTDQQATDEITETDLDFGNVGLPVSVVNNFLSLVYHLEYVFDENTYHREVHEEFSGNFVAALFENNNDSFPIIGYFAASSQTSYTQHTWNVLLDQPGYEGRIVNESFNTMSLQYTVTVDGKTAYYSSRAMEHEHDESYSAPFNLTSGNSASVNSNVIWSMVYGTKTPGQSAGSRQKISVSWHRPHDGKVLETTFEILVAPGYTPGGGE